MEINTTIGIIAFFSALGVFILMYGLLAPVKEKVEDNHAFLSNPNSQMGEKQTNKDDLLGSYIHPILDSFLPQFPHINISDEQQRKIEKLIITAGNPWKINSQEFVALSIIFAIVGSVLGSIFAFSGVIPPVLPPVVLILFFALAGGMLPMSTHNTLKEKRTKIIDKELPEFMDLLVITMEAGRTFSLALDEVTDRFAPGLLKTEFQKTVLQIQSGVTLTQAFTTLQERFTSESLESFAKAIIQTEKLGASAVETLTQQAEYIRSNYEAKLEKMIGKLETMLMIPMGLAMLPGFILILIAPTISQISEYMG